MSLVGNLDRGVDQYTRRSLAGVMYTVKVVRKEETFRMVTSFDTRRTEFGWVGDFWRRNGPRVGGCNVSLTRRKRQHRLTIVDHLPAPLLDSHLAVLGRLVHIWLGWEHDNSIPTCADLDWLLLLDSVNRYLVLGVWPEDSERCTTDISGDPSVI